MSSEFKTYYIWTMGCQMNHADARRAASILESFQLVPVDHPDEADLILLITCVVRRQTEEKIAGRMGILKRIKEERPGVVNIVMGCLVGQNWKEEGERLQKHYPFIDYFLPPSGEQFLLDILEQEGIQNSKNEGIFLECLPPPRGRTSVVAEVNVIYGCNHRCTYCIIPLRRGKERSRPLLEILSEVEVLVQHGIKEVTLLGQIVDRYGADLRPKLTLAELLRHLHELDGLLRIRFLTSHPLYFSDELITTVANLPKICPQFEIPIQSGSDSVLKRMRRGYNRQRYEELIQKIRSQIPDAAIHTDLIVGFCGETEEDFEATRDLVERIKFDKIHLARYSPRPGTYAAAHWIDDVPPQEKRRRWQIIDELQEKILLEKNRGYLHQELEILVEGQQKQRWFGRTRQNRLVFFDVPESEKRSLALGQLVKVKVEHAGAYSLSGMLVSQETCVSQS